MQENRYFDVETADGDWLQVAAPNMDLAEEAAVKAGHSVECVMECEDPEGPADVVYTSNQGRYSVARLWLLLQEPDAWGQYTEIADDALVGTLGASYELHPDFKAALADHEAITGGTPNIRA